MLIFDLVFVGWVGFFPPDLCCFPLPVRREWRLCCLVGNSFEIGLGVAIKGSRQNVFLGIRSGHLEMGWAAMVHRRDLLSPW